MGEIEYRPDFSPLLHVPKYRCIAKDKFGYRCRQAARRPNDACPVHRRGPRKREFLNTVTLIRHVYDRQARFDREGDYFYWSYGARRLGLNTVEGVRGGYDQEVMNERLIEEITPQINPWGRFEARGGFDAIASAQPNDDDRVTVEIHRGKAPAEVRRVRRDWADAIEAILDDGSEPEPPPDAHQQRLKAAVAYARRKMVDH